MCSREQGTQYITFGLFTPLDFREGIFAFAHFFEYGESQLMGYRQRLVAVQIKTCSCPGCAP
jgi:hypothetical protein